MTEKEKEQKRREECPYYWKKKGVKYGVCSASPHSHHEDDPCDLNDCFWMKEWFYETTGENDR